MPSSELESKTAAQKLHRRIFSCEEIRREVLISWALVLPALLMYAMFVLLPLFLSIYYSFFRWNGVGPMTWVGLKNYLTILQFPNLLGSIFNAFKLILYFSFVPVGLGLVVASVINRVAPGRFGALPVQLYSCPDHSLVAAGIIWGWLLHSQLINEILWKIGLIINTCMAWRFYLGFAFSWGDRHMGAAWLLHCSVVDWNVKIDSSL